MTTYLGKSCSFFCQGSQTDDEYSKRGLTYVLYAVSLILLLKVWMLRLINFRVLWFLTVPCSCCPYLYFGSAIMLVTYFSKLLSIYVFSYFPFGFEGRMWDLIVSVPDHCLSFYFPLTVIWLLCLLQERSSDMFRPRYLAFLVVRRVLPWS